MDTHIVEEVEGNLFSRFHLEIYSRSRLEEKNTFFRFFIINNKWILDCIHTITLRITSIYI